MDALRWYWKVDDRDGSVHLATDIDTTEHVSVDEGWTGPFPSDDDAYDDMARAVAPTDHNPRGLPLPDGDAAERLLAAVFNSLYCHNCDQWTRATSDDHGETFHCDECGDVVLCDQCGRPWNAVDHERGADGHDCRRVDETVFAFEQRTTAPI